MRGFSYIRDISEELLVVNLSQHVLQVTQNGQRVRTETVVVVGLRGPHLSVADPASGLHGVLKVHVHVWVVRRSHHGNLVLVQLCVVVQATPVLLLSQQVRNLSQRTQRGILLVVPGEDVLAGEEQTIRIRSGREAATRAADQLVGAGEGDSS